MIDGRGIASPLAALGLAALAVCLATINTAHANNNAKNAKNYLGQWCGPGKIVAGKYDKTNFTCELELSINDRQSKLTMGGNCRVGVFPKRMQAQIDLSTSSLKGAFFPNSPPDRLNIDGGKIEPKRARIDINREQIDGEVSLRLNASSQLQGTVSVRAGLQMIPVIELSLRRCGG